jgi:hypothetical protein
MDVAFIEMPAEVAREELKTYRKALHRRADAEYEAIANGLEALAEGTPLLQMSRVFADCPRDEKGRPRLAIARADRRRVMYENRSRNYSLGFDQFNAGYDTRGPQIRDGRIEVPSANAPRTGYVAGYALVPLVPPDVRGGRGLRHFFTLWEVEKWSDRATDVGPDRDPYLLHRISADLYAVVGEWDLTPVEQAILAGRREG